MTSFGRGDETDGTTGWTVEIRTVNHKFCDIRIKIPRQLNSLEEKIKKEVTRYFSRGHVDVIITPTGLNTDSKEFHVNKTLARQYYKCLLQLKREMAIPASANDLTLLANYPDVIKTIEQQIDVDQIWSSLQTVILQALNICQDMREREGVSLKKDLLERIDSIQDTVNGIETRIPDLVTQKKTALQERIVKLLANSEISPERFDQEVALLADKLDVTEEIVRLRSHINQFRHFLALNEPVGRRLDFLLQEFLREINTTASKISDASIAHLTVELKNEVEKIREQVQNLE
jgi:uncharacterized protein (TIGR00255 family)